ncbi:hypothetical protein HPB50_010109 [Hyalomma asiaticum]|uniref:Uncharacterized protein n=1 Tax=Hyalomma asiaticum TaxID=266040 RepID=A0ACB7RRE8_HYAAI|nr:hypothetical protein HPB50_010109 [Hyalomma asiaticum]
MRTRGRVESSAPEREKRDEEAGTALSHRSVGRKQCVCVYTVGTTRPPKPNMRAPFYQPRGRGESSEADQTLPAADPPHPDARASVAVRFGA